MDDARQNVVLVSMALAMVSGVLCAVLFDALFTGDWHTWVSDSTKRFGFTFTGWLVGFSAALALCAYLSGMEVSFMLNFFLPSMAIAQAIGRVGCFIGGCCYGAACDCGVLYPPGSLPYSILGSVRVFPVQLCEAGCLLVLFGACISVPFRYRGGVYLVGVGVIRFILEFFRGDVRGSVFGIEILSPQQLLSIAFFAFGTMLLKNAKSLDHGS